MDMPCRVGSRIICALYFSLSILLCTSALTLRTSAQAWAAETVCSRSDVLLCEDWETGRDGWGWNNNWSSASGVKCGNVGLQSDCALQLHFAQNAPDAIYPEHAISPQNGTVHARFYIKYSVGYRWNAPGSKVFYIRSDSGGNFSWAAQLGSYPESSSNLTGPGKFYMDIQTHGVRLPYNKGTSVDGRITQGQWYAVEMMAQPNTLGQSNGSVKLWINGVLVMDYTGLDLRKNAVDPTSPINKIWVSAYIGGPTDPHPAQDIWYDNIVAAKSYIGLSNTTNQLSPPQNLRIAAE